MITDDDNRDDRATFGSVDQQQPAQRRPTWRRWASSALVSVLIAGGWWWWWMGPARPRSDKSTPAPQNKAAEHGPRGPASNGDGQAGSAGHSADGNGHSSAADAAGFDASRTSWQDPFEASYWESQGWEFQPQAMLSSGPAPATAAFRRDYRKVTIECRVAPVGKPGVFQIRLFDPETDALLLADFSSESASVSADIKGRRTLIERRRVGVPFAAEKPALLRLTATGNRVLVIIGRKVVINCSQPAEQSGKPLRLSLCAASGAFRVSGLRLEGE